MAEDIFDSEDQRAYWSARYDEARTGWDIGYPSTPLKEYIDQIEDKNIRILIPGAGNAHEAAYLFEQGFSNTVILDISPIPLEAFQKRFPDFPKAQLVNENFFSYQGQFDLIIEQTFFCSIPPLSANREAYALQMSRLLKSGGKLVGLWFDIPLTGDLEKRPFGGTKKAYLGYFEPYFSIKTFESAHNSIPPRAGNELFGIFLKQ